LNRSVVWGREKKKNSNTLGQGVEPGHLRGGAIIEKKKEKKKDNPKM